MTLTNKSRFRGCLLGGAVGDALGAPVEFQKLASIIKQHGPDGVTGYLPAYGGIGKITDDTQMTLFTAEAFMRGVEREKRSGKPADWLALNGEGLQRWYATQTQRFDPQYDGLLGEFRLFSQRAPGATCMSSIRAMKSTTQMAVNNSKGCGTVMRMAPVGLFAFAAGREDAFEMANDFGHQTHGHPTGWLAGGFLADLVVKLLAGTQLRDAVIQMLDRLAFEPDSEELHAIVLKATKLAGSGLEHRKAIALLGEGWIAEEALAISLYCALVAEDFRHGVLLAVNHDGDTDSTGAIAGNILGLLLGVDAIPLEWRGGVELADVIEDMADSLLEVGA